MRNLKSENEVLFLDVDDALAKCANCLQKNKKCRRLWNKSAILKNIHENKNILLMTKDLDRKVDYNAFSRILSHYKICRFSQKFAEIKLDLSKYKLLSFGIYPNS